MLAVYYVGLLSPVKSLFTITAVSLALAVIPPTLHSSTIFCPFS
jgi:hypothetical protein